MDRSLTDREREVLDALLSVDFEGVERLRDEARSARVVGRCACGCPSIDFRQGGGMEILVNGGVVGSFDGLFLYSLDGHLGGIEWVSGGDDPTELPEPGRLHITRAEPGP
ncbi:hypothetical protein ACIOWF_05630 [Cellulosimicrobium cellulans]|uniref:Uncharacterized protein n=1 Tax=Cellulosimicrobium cellulans F16 TaxID=1350482 RepID=A0A0M0FBX1_CELCE|nr:hypothetical protein [Cellulosimicrobium cellulans]KON75094.1 hypothetical protein M768_03895 [Cellulosimicrobium cellulans F16]